MIKIASLTVVFPVCVLRNSLTWITWTAARTPFALTGRVSLSHTHIPYILYRLFELLHKHVASALTHSHQWGDVIRVLMRDYSDITGTAAKLNLLASPCACGALQLELCASMCDMQEPLEKIVPSTSVCIQLSSIHSSLH